MDSKLTKLSFIGVQVFSSCFFFIFMFNTEAFLYFNKSLIFVFKRKTFLTHVMHVPTSRHFPCFYDSVCGAIWSPNTAFLSCIWKGSKSLPWWEVRAPNTHPICSQQAIIFFFLFLYPPWYSHEPFYFYNLTPSP